MSSKSVVRITTEDTKKTYEFPGLDNPQLWAVTLQIKCVDGGGFAHFSSPSFCTERIIHVERETLANAGLIGRPVEKEDKPLEETAEDLILRLLEHVGVYPVE